ncbi:hypothetical protein H6771_03090 [Candidatus Peribacteria bacterium]|nr:hypothetical protein [Candidatus Peribacteria bacterium]
MDTLLDIWNTLPFFVKILLAFIIIIPLLQFFSRLRLNTFEPIVHTFTIENFIKQLYDNPKLTLEETTPTGIKVSLAFLFRNQYHFEVYGPWECRDETAVIVVYWKVISATGTTTKGKYEIKKNEWYNERCKPGKFYLRRIGDYKFYISEI